MKKKMPFSFTPPVIRYLEEMVSEIEKRNRGLLDGQRIGAFSLTFDTYRDDEPFMSHYEEMRTAFWQYLESRGGVEILPIEGTSVRSFEDRIEARQYDDLVDFLAGTESNFPNSFTVNVLDEKPVLEVWNYYAHSPKGNIIKSIAYDASQNVKYDERTKRLSYHDAFLRFQTKAKDPRKLRLFELLWKNRTHRLNGIEKAHPHPLGKEDLSERLAMPLPKLMATIKAMNHQLAGKGIPIRIDTLGATVRMKVSDKV